MTFRRTRPLAIALAGLLALTACGGEDEPDDPASAPASSDDAGSDAGSDDGAAFPVTITHAYGETTIEEEPLRVLAWDWSTQDAVIGLDVAPVAMPTYTYGGDENGLLPWVAEALEERGMEVPTLLTYGAEIPFEEIDQADPDVILAVNSGVSEEDYETLSSIAPTVVQPGDVYATPWQEQIDMVGRALGRTAEADALVAETEQLIAAQAEAYPQIEGAEFVYTSGDASTGVLTVYVPGDVRVRLLTELGMTLAPYVEATMPDDGNFSFDVSLETVDQVESELLVAWFGDEAAAEAFESDPLVSQVPAVAAGGFVPVVGAQFVMATSAVSAVSIAWALDDYVALLADAVDAAGVATG